MGRGARYHPSIDSAFDAFGRFSAYPHRRRRALQAIEDVLVLASTRAPQFYVTSGGHYVGVEGDDGRRIMRIEAASIRSATCANGFHARTSEPDGNLPYELKL